MQQVGAAGRQVAGDGHDGHAVSTLLGSHNAVVLRLTHATITGKESRDGEGRQGTEKKKGVILQEREKERERIRFLMF